MSLTHGSLFTGVGGIDLGFDKSNIKTLWQCEIDKKARSVLAQHWPKAIRYTDVSKVDGFTVKPVDIITFGSPCQDLSIAGKRAGFQDGTRSNLYFEAVRIIKEMRHATKNQYPRYAVWENVRGALSSNGGQDFLAAIQALADIGAMDVSWRLVNTCYFGPPQRRVRVFVVADFGGERAGEILSEPTRVCWHPSTSGTSGQTTPSETSSSLANGRNIANTISAELYHKSTVVNQDVNNGHLVLRSPILGFDIVGALNTSDAKMISTQYVNENKVVVESSIAAVAYTLRMREGKEGGGKGPLISEEKSLTLGAATNDQTVFQARAVAYDEYNDTLGEHVHHALRAGTKQSTGVVESSMDVRRLTPRECERLQGWPDDHTRWGEDDTEISDSARYKMIGNGVSAPVAQWLGENICAVHIKKRKSKGGVSEC